MPSIVVSKLIIDVNLLDFLSDFSNFDKSAF